MSALEATLLPQRMQVNIIVCNLLGNSPASDY
jgi:hypothetical protein